MNKYHINHESVLIILIRSSPTMGFIILRHSTMGMQSDIIIIIYSSRYQGSSRNNLFVEKIIITRVGLLNVTKEREPVFFGLLKQHHPIVFLSI